MLQGRSGVRLQTIDLVKSANDNINVVRVELDSVFTAPGFFRGNQWCAAASKYI